MTSFRPGDRVVVLPGLGPGCVRFVGPARLFRGAIEVVIGVELDAEAPPSSAEETEEWALRGERGDGMIAGMRYFVCPERRAVFVRRDGGHVLLDRKHEGRRDKAALTIQTSFRRFQAFRVFRSKLASKTWNVLDMHVEDLGIKRGSAVERAKQQLQNAVMEDESEEELAARVMALAEKEVSELTMDFLASIKTSPDYDGPILRFPLALDAVKAMLEDFRMGKIIHYKFFMALLLQCRALFNEENTVQDIPVPEGSTINVVGDTHGQIDDLFTIFSLQGLPSPTNMYLFNGDFVDRGTAGCEIVAVMCAFKILYPGSVFLNRGNHEARAQNAWMGFEEEILAKYTLPETTIEGDRRAALRVHILCEQVFDALPLCAVIAKRVFVCHGGLFRSDGVSLNHLRSISRKREPPLAGRSFEDRIFEDLLWSDPRPTPTYPRALTGRRPSDRGAGCEFGPAVTNQFCATNQVALVIRSHECVSEGFEVIHNGRLITIFSASRYCGTQTNKGAYICFGSNLQPQVHQFYAETQTAAFITDDERRQALEEDAVFMIVEQICDKKLDLYWYFTKNDVERTGTVSRAAWAQALQNVLGLDLPFLHYASYLIDDDSKGLPVNYSKFLSRFQVRGRESDSQWQDAVISRVVERLKQQFGFDGNLDSAWRRFDSKNSGRIDFSEFYETLKILDVGLTDQQIYEFMRGVDADQDAHISLAEFKARFGPVLEAKTRSPRASSVEARAAQTKEEQLVWRTGVVENVVNVLYQIRIHVRAALRNHFDLENHGKIPKPDFLKGMRALNESLGMPLTVMQVDELATALDHGDGLIAYREFFDGLQIHDSSYATNAGSDSAASPVSSSAASTAAGSAGAGGTLMRKSSSFYVMRLEREESQRAKAGLRRESSLRMQALRGSPQQTRESLTAQAQQQQQAQQAQQQQQQTGSPYATGGERKALSAVAESSSSDEDDEHARVVGDKGDEDLV